jgi:hypothetical protein
MKIDIEQVEATLLERKVEPIKVQEILRDLAKAVEEEKADAAATKSPKAKWEHIILINDLEGKFSKSDEFTGWVVVQEDGEDSGVIVSKLLDASKTQNETARRKKSLIQDFTTLFQALKPKFLKEKKLKIKTKEPVRVMFINGKTL